MDHGTVSVSLHLAAWSGSDHGVVSVSLHLGSWPFKSNVCKSDSACMTVLKWLSKQKESLVHAFLFSRVPIHLVLAVVFWVLQCDELKVAAGNRNKKSNIKPINLLLVVRPLLLGAESFSGSVEWLRQHALMGCWLHPADVSWSNEVRFKLIGFHCPIPKYRTKVSVLFNGWICFQFLCPKDSKIIIKEPWIKGRGFVICRDGKRVLIPLRSCLEGI